MEMDYQGGQDLQNTEQLPVRPRIERTQRILYPDTPAIPPVEVIGQKAFKIFQMANDSRFRVPRFFFVMTDQSGELRITEELEQAFCSLKRPLVARSAHPWEGQLQSFSGVFQSFCGITELSQDRPDTTGLDRDEADLVLWDFFSENPIGLTEAYRQIVELATPANGNRVERYLAAHGIDEFDPAAMNLLVMEEVANDEVFGMFLTSDQLNTRRIFIHYEDRRPERKLPSFDLRRTSSPGGIVTFNKETGEVEDHVSDDIRPILCAFGRQAEAAEEKFGSLQQVEYKSEGGVVYDLQSIDIRLSDASELPRFAHYTTISRDLHATGFGYLRLPIVVIDEIRNTRFTDEVGRATREEHERNAALYLESLREMAERFGDYALIIKDAFDVIGRDLFKVDYSKVNELAMKAKVIWTGRNQTAIRHEDWEQIHTGGLRVIPPENNGLSELFGFEAHGPRRSYALSSGDILYFLSNLDGCFVWPEESEKLWVCR